MIWSLNGVLPLYNTVGIRQVYPQAAKMSKMCDCVILLTSGTRHMPLFLKIIVETFIM